MKANCSWDSHAAHKASSRCPSEGEAPPAECDRGSGGENLCVATTSNYEVQFLDRKPAAAKYSVGADGLEMMVDEWFETQVLVHEGALMRYLGRSWSNHSELDDIRQEIYVRVYEAATKSLPEKPKAFLFTTARHLLIDHIRRRRVVSIDAIGGWAELDDLSVTIDEPSSETRASAKQELRLLAVAFDGLPPRCREVLWLRRVEGMSQKEVAHELDISEGATEKALARAVQLLAKRIWGADERGEERKSGAKPHEYESTLDRFESDRSFRYGMVGQAPQS